MVTLHLTSEHHQNHLDSSSGNHDWSNSSNKFGKLTDIYCVFQCDDDANDLKFNDTQRNQMLRIIFTGIVTLYDVNMFP